jgi:23S rRNA (uracil1939-C5)-methyltransferase
LALARENLSSARVAAFALTDNEWVKTKKTLGTRADYGLIVADPPRQGLSPAIRHWLAQGPAPVFAYVSCDPATLARDSKELLNGVWELEGLTYYDFYPQTAHIESLAVFRNKRPGGTRGT